MKYKLDGILITREEIAKKVEEMGAKITEDYQGKNLLLVSVLKGSVVFMSDLMRSIETGCEIDFISISSYGSGVKTSGVVKLIKDLDIDIKEFDVLIVEDILDSGLTLSYIMELLSARNPKSLAVCTLLDKPERRQSKIEADYCGFKIPDEFVVGYGLDFNGKYRNLPHIGILKTEETD